MIPRYILVVNPELMARIDPEDYPDVDLVMSVAIP